MLYTVTDTQVKLEVGSHFYLELARLIEESRLILPYVQTDFRNPITNNGRRPPLGKLE